MGEPLLFGQALRQQIADTALGAGSMAVWALGHCGLLFKYHSTLGVVDPYLFDALDERGLGPRQYPAPLAPDELAGLGLVAITGSAADLFDPRSLTALLKASPQALLVLPAGLADVAADDMGVPDDRMVPISAGQLFEAQDCVIHALGADSSDEPTELCYVVSSEQGAVYLGGAALPYAGQALSAAPFGPTVAFLPISGRGVTRQQRGVAGTLTVAEAARLAAEMGADYIVPTHYDLFEIYRGDPGALQDVVAAEYPHLRVKVLEVGERWILGGDNAASVENA